MWCLCAEQDSLSREVEVGAAGHLACEGFDAADGALVIHRVISRTVGAARVPALLQAGGEMVLAAGARARADDHWAGGGGAGELADGVPRQAQHLGDLGVVLALREQVMGRGVAFPAADRQAALGTARARSLGGHVGGDAAAWPAGLPIAGFRGGIR